MDRSELANTKRWVVKIGSALLTNDGAGLNTDALADWVDQMVALRKQGVELLLVSSGAVAEGMTRLGWRTRPDSIHELQAAAAVGQMGLVQHWETAFQRHDLHTAQVLLVHDDLSHRQRYLNARSTLKTLLSLGVVPVVNENDTVVTDEIRFGDNDTLAALVANLVDADMLLILTDQQALYERDPRQDPQAPVVSQAAADDDRLLEYASGGAGVLGRGGMLTKVRAARLAARSGSHTVIASGHEPDILQRIRDGQDAGTLLTASCEPQAARKQWLAGHLQTRGTLVLDDGAAAVVRRSGKSLLPVGVSRVEGEFVRGEMVSCVDPSGNEIARGLVNYNADEARKIAGANSSDIRQLLGYHDDDVLIHRDNLVLV